VPPPVAEVGAAPSAAIPRRGPSPLRGSPACETVRLEEPTTVSAEVAAASGSAVGAESLRPILSQDARTGRSEHPRTEAVASSTDGSTERGADR